MKKYLIGLLVGLLVGVGSSSWYWKKENKRVAYIDGLYSQYIAENNAFMEREKFEEFWWGDTPRCFTSKDSQSGVVCNPAAVVARANKEYGFEQK